MGCRGVLTEWGRGGHGGVCSGGLVVGTRGSVVGEGIPYWSTRGGPWQPIGALAPHCCHGADTRPSPCPYVRMTGGLLCFPLP